MEVLDRTVRHQQTMLKIQIRPSLSRAVECLLHEISVVGMNSMHYQLQCRLNRSITLKDLVGFLRPEDFSTRNVPAETACMAQFLRLRQVSFAPPQLFFSPPPLVNVRKQVIPTDNATFSVTQRQATRMKPPVRTVSTAQTVVNVIGIPGFDRVPPCGDRLREIIRVDGFAGTPTFQFFKSLAEVFQVLVVDEFDLAFRSHYGYQAGDAIDDQANTLFTLPQLRIEAGVLERNRGLRSQQLQHCDPLRRERARSQIVL